MSYDAEPSIRAVKTILVRQARYRNNVKLIRYINTAIDQVMEAKQPQDLDSAYPIQSDHYADFVKAMKFKDEGEIASTELALNMVHEKLTTEVASGIGAHITRIQLLIQSLCELDVSILEREEHKDVLRAWHRGLHGLIKSECSVVANEMNNFKATVWSWVLDKNVSNVVKDLDYTHEVDRNIAKLTEAHKYAMVARAGAWSLIRVVIEMGDIDNLLDES
jgi:hypothetical protein